MIVKTLDTCGGAARIDGTRMSVWFLVVCKRSRTDAEILTSYPHLTQSQLDEAWAYCLQNQREIDHEIKGNFYGFEEVVDRILAGKKQGICPSCGNKGILNDSCPTCPSESTVFSSPPK